MNVPIRFEYMARAERQIIDNNPAPVKKIIENESQKKKQFTLFSIKLRKSFFRLTFDFKTSIYRNWNLNLKNHFRNFVQSEE